MEEVSDLFEAFVGKKVVLYVNVGSGAQQPFFGILKSYTKAKSVESFAAAPPKQPSFVLLEFRDGRLQMFNMNDISSIKEDNGRRIS